MLCRFLTGVLIVFAIGFSPFVSKGEENNVQKEAAVFSNQDIEKYKKPSDNKTAYIKTDRAAERKEKTLEIKEEKEKEYWCKRANPYRKKIERIKEEAGELEKLNTKKAGKRLENARKRLKYAEKDLAELEDEAHRKGIPPGWLRCQFE